MADDAATTTEDTQITFNVKAANDQKHVLTLPNTTTVADLKAKLSTPEYADVPAERQRLIYSGRVLKDPDTLASVKIKDGHTVHLVKGAASNARQNPANQGTSSTASGGNTQTPQVPTNIAAGTGNNPLAGLTGARYAGFHGLPGMDTFGPDGGMGGPPTNPEAMLEQMENPMFLSQLNEAMNNPAVVDMMLQSPMIRDNPMLQQVLRNPEMRRMMFSPEMMRMQLQMQRNMGNSGPSFPAPGATDNTTQPGSTATDPHIIHFQTPNCPRSLLASESARLHVLKCMLHSPTAINWTPSHSRDICFTHPRLPRPLPPVVHTSIARSISPTAANPHIDNCQCPASNYRRTTGATKSFLGLTSSPPTSVRRFSKNLHQSFPVAISESASKRPIA